MLKQKEWILFGFKNECKKLRDPFILHMNVCRRDWVSFTTPLRFLFTLVWLTFMSFCQLFSSMLLYVSMMFSCCLPCMHSHSLFHASFSRVSNMREETRQQETWSSEAFYSTNQQEQGNQRENVLKLKQRFNWTCINGSGLESCWANSLSRVNITNGYRHLIPYL